MTVPWRYAIRNTRYVFFVLILLITYHLSLITPTFAQTSTTPSATSASSLNPIPYTLPTSISPTSPLYTDLLVNNMFHTFSCLAIGQSMIGQPCLSYQMTKNAQGMIQSVPVLSQTNLQGGALGATTSIIGMLYQNPPVKTADYLASVGQGLGIVKEANAQVTGSGAAVLSPILKLWQVSRNISYVIMIIIFIVIGLMVMFRNKINPQTVITAQAALPGLVIGLIMITFSYFLAGLVSDTAFLGTNIIGYYFTTAQGKPPQNLVEDMKTQNILSIFSPFTGIIDQGSATNILDSIWGNLGQAPQQLLTLLGVFITAQTTTQASDWLKMFPGFGAPIQALIVAVAGVTTAVAPTFMIGFALAFIATAILLYVMFKLLLRLINAYLTIIFLTFTAPFQLLAAALPGRQGIATDWILNLLANVLAFPAVLAVLYFVAFLLGSSGLKNCATPQQKCVFEISATNQRNNSSLTRTAFAAGSVVDSSTFPLFGGMDISFLNLILAFGALIALPAIPDIISRTVGKMSQTGQLIGQEIGGGISTGRQYAGQFQQGVGAGSQQLAQARGAFGETGWAYGQIKGAPPGTEGWYRSKAPMTGAKPSGPTKLRSWLR